MNDLWVRCYDGVGVGVDVCALEQVNSAYAFCELGVGGEGVVDVFVPFVGCVFLVPVLWFDEYVYGFPFA